MHPPSTAVKKFKKENPVHGSLDTPDFFLVALKVFALRLRSETAVGACSSLIMKCISSFVRSSPSVVLSRATKIGLHTSVA